MHTIAPDHGPLCQLGTCPGCDAERFAKYDEKLQRHGAIPDAPHLHTMRDEFGPPSWLDEAMAGLGFVSVALTASVS